MRDRQEHENTISFRVDGDAPQGAAGVLTAVYESLLEKGYNPVSQIVGYLLSGDPTFITSHRDARSLVRTVERDELLEELVRSYLSRTVAARRGTDERL